MYTLMSMGGRWCIPVESVLTTDAVFVQCNLCLNGLHTFKMVKTIDFSNKKFAEATISKEGQFYGLGIDDN